MLLILKASDSSDGYSSFDAWDSSRSVLLLNSHSPGPVNDFCLTGHYRFQSHVRRLEGESASQGIPTTFTLPRNLQYAQPFPLHIVFHFHPLLIADEDARTGNIRIHH